MTETYVAFVINQTETEYTIISERDKKYHILPLPIIFGNTRLPDESVVTIQEIVFGPHQLYIACKGYKYDITKKRNKYQKRAEAAKATKTTKVNPIENPFNV